jgi:hypothetical protein
MQLYGVNIQTYQPSILEPTKHQKKLFHNPNPPNAPTIHLVHLDEQLDGDNWLLHYDVFKPLEVPPQGPEIVELSNELGSDNEAQVHLDAKLADEQYYSIFSNKRKTPPTAHTINIPTPELMTKKQKVIAKNLAAAATKATTTASNPLTTSTSVPAPPRPQPYLKEGRLSKISRPPFCPSWVTDIPEQATAIYDALVARFKEFNHHPNPCPYTSSTLLNERTPLKDVSPP